MMSIAVISTSTEWRNASMSNSRLSPTYFIRLSDARLHAESSMCMYSEHGFEALIGPVFGQVCQLLMVV